MDITYLGHSSFRIRGKTSSIVTDPYDSQDIGLKFPRHVECTLATVSHEHRDHNAVSQLEGNPYIIRGPGEYEIHGISVIGVPSFHDDVRGQKRGGNTIYIFEIEGIRLVHLGDIGVLPGSSEIESMNGVDVLFIPVGGIYTISSGAAAKLVSEIEPSIVIPMHYKRSEIQKGCIVNLEPVENFLHEMEQEHVSPLAKLSITKDKLPAETQVVILEQKP